ncbi:MAG: PilZ domain-containing protein [Dissulfurimicrobium sp.]|uniref:PilZ domain-containing protein n=1 Tax=Dissulfurimicrobium TaxID=1769732 RepID=UPI001EDA0296|nr:PilZ domain-containing protein [Dissulfurimicrobium hydrothermale]UKL13375.1 PilZ domain-containing protein [Dissulfurimicrobium hydrothermale]
MRRYDDEAKKDNRSYVRIKDEVFLRVTAVEEDEYTKAMDLREKGQDLRSSGSTYQFFDKKLSLYIQRLKERDDVLANILEMLDKKLDFILKNLLVGKGDSLPDELYEVDISAAGIGFRHSEPFSRDQLLRIELLIPPEMIFIRCYGRVLRCISDADGGFRIAVRFIWVNEADQDLLVEHIFNKQMLQLQLVRRQREETKS